MSSTDVDFDGAPTPYSPPGPGSRTAYRGASVLDADGTAWREATTIVVEGGTITRVAPDDEVALGPADGLEVVDLKGRFVIPGLIDAHQHIATPPNRPQAEAWLHRQVAGGVTAIRDMADDLRQIADLARATRVGEIPGPDILYAALMAGASFFDDPRTWQVAQGEVPGQVPWMQAVTDETDLSLAVARGRGTHAIAIKIYANLPPHLVARITDEAHRQGMLAWAHAAVFPALLTPGPAAHTAWKSPAQEVILTPTPDRAASPRGGSRLRLRSMKPPHSRRLRPTLRWRMRRLVASITHGEQPITRSTSSRRPHLVRQDEKQPLFGAVSGTVLA